MEDVQIDYAVKLGGAAREKFIREKLGITDDELIKKLVGSGQNGFRQFLQRRTLNSPIAILGSH